MANLKLAPDRSCEKSRTAVQALARILSHYLARWTLRNTTNAIAEIVPSSLITQLLISAGYFASFANVVIAGSQTTMSPGTMDKMIISTSGSCTLIFFLAFVMGVSAVIRLHEVYRTEQDNVSLVAVGEAPWTVPDNHTSRDYHPS